MRALRGPPARRMIPRLLTARDISAFTGEAYDTVLRHIRKGSYGKQKPVNKGCVRRIPVEHVAKAHGVEIGSVMACVPVSLNLTPVPAHKPRFHTWTEAGEQWQVEIPAGKKREARKAIKSNPESLRAAFESAGLTPERA